jgi:ADP-heptose:LPS heptosyltransferase
LKLQLGAELHFLTKRSFSGILSSNPYLDRVYSFEKEVDEVLPDLKKERYDWVIDLHNNLRSARLKFALGRPSRSFPKKNLEKWMLVHTGIDWMPQAHIVDRYLRAVRHLGVQADGEGLDYFIPAADEFDLGMLHAQGLAGNFVAFVLGATHATKRLPLESMAQLVATIQAPIVLLGGKSEAAIGEYLATKGKKVFNLCGKLSLNQSASVIAQSEVVLTHDTGLMHIAAAKQKKIVVVWGNTTPRFGMYPYEPKGIATHDDFEINELSCRPCSKIGYEKCPKGHFKCMMDQDLGAIAQRVDLQCVMQPI